MGTFWVVIYLILGFVNCILALEMFEPAFGIIFGFIISLALGEFPLFGAAIGMLGAIRKDWAIWQILLLPVVHFLVLYFYSKSK